MGNNESSYQEGLTLLDLWQLFRGNIIFIVSVTIMFFTFVSIYAWLIVTPDYISNADVMVQVEQSSSSTTSDTNYDFVNAFRLIDTIAELMEKEIILNNALTSLEELGYDKLDISYLRAGLSVKSSSTSYFINISFVDETPVLAMEVVDQVIDAVIQETNVKDAFPVLTDKIRRTSYASEATYNSPNKILYSFLGLFLGIFFSSLVVFTKELFSNKFKNKEEIEQIFNIQVLGVIPLMNKKVNKNEKK
jgi:capsular polysaccharide biosynthesis protein